MDFRPKDSDTCWYCVFYYQHYEEHGHAINAGHCGQMRIRDLEPDHKRCECFKRTDYPPLTGVPGAENSLIGGSSRDFLKSDERIRAQKEFPPRRAGRKKARP